eukprot:8851941-Alexandrium_andersonii.AAC.1
MTLNPADLGGPLTPRSDGPLDEGPQVPVPPEAPRHPRKVKPPGLDQASRADNVPVVQVDPKRRWD